MFTEYISVCDSYGFTENGSVRTQLYLLVTRTYDLNISYSILFWI